MTSSHSKAINLNDGFGGATNITSNLIFNQCRETGDHGPINSWDRTAYISDVLTGEPSYSAAMNHVSKNMIIANYGSSQGFDTDDGSSWYNISSNFFFDADATKMDYGGHDMAFQDNIIYVRDGDGQNCFNSGSYLPGHGLTYTGNKCIVPFSKTLGTSSGCDCQWPDQKTDEGAMLMAHTDGVEVGNTFPLSPKTVCGIAFQNNEYFGIDQNLSISCANPPLAFQDWQARGNDKGSKQWALPTDDELLFWARERLGLPAPPGPAPPPPKPLPPPPQHHWPNTCEGRCGKGGHCCIGMTSGCAKPNCDMGCALAKRTSSLVDCLAGQYHRGS